MKVLIVDDSHIMVEVLELLFKDKGFEVLSADASKSALNLLEKQKFDLMITDINMPGMSGIDLGLEVRKNNTLMPIILFTGQINKFKDYKSSLDKIGNAYYIESKDLDELLKTIKKIFPKI
jgi:DNA-binding response OmpR family regulator